MCILSGVCQGTCGAGKGVDQCGKCVNRFKLVAEIRNHHPCYGAQQSLRAGWKGFWRGGGFVTLSVPMLAENLSTELDQHWCWQEQEEQGQTLRMPLAPCSCANPWQW